MNKIGQKTAEKNVSATRKLVKTHNKGDLFCDKMLNVNRITCTLRDLLKRERECVCVCVCACVLERERVERSRDQVSTLVALSLLLLLKLEHFW